MRATEWLKRDHDLILEGLDVLQRVAEGVGGGATVPVDKLRELLRFFREFADQYHHKKEEDALFPALEGAGMPNQGPIGVMLQEHDEGRRLLQEMKDGLPNLDPATAFDYIDLLRSHIDKENQVLFHMADRMLSAADDDKLMGQFLRAEEEMAKVVDVVAWRKVFAGMGAGTQTES